MYNGVYRGASLQQVAFPIGGIGAGMFCLEGTGAISHLSVRNNPEIFNEPAVFAAISIKQLPGSARVLEGPVPAWKKFGQRDAGFGAPGTTWGLPRFREAEFLARFPFGEITLKDKELPMEVHITGWSPFIPTDADNSSLPAGALEYTFRNTGKQTMDYIFSYNARNFMALPDERGKEPAANHIRAIRQGFVLSRQPLALPAHAWGARVAVTGGHGYLFADNADLLGWQTWLKSNAGSDLAEYKDFGGGVYRAASFAADSIETCLFIGPARDAGDWNVVKGLFAADTLGTDQRRMLLSGKSMDGLANAGPIVCACFGVGRNTICDTIAGGARSAADIGARLKAGTNCGSCIPELKRLIAQTATGDPGQRKLAAAN